MADFTQIRYEVQGSIATLTLSRPEKLNAFTLTMMREMISAFDMADADDSVRAVIVTGEGRAFCAGADLSGGESSFDHTDTAAHRAGRVPRDGGGMLTLRIFRSQKPVIGAINGAAVGVGVTMTLPMDVRVASTSARFGFVFSRRGIVPEAASSWFLPRVVGISRALEWTFSGRVFDADEALAGGLVRSLHAPDELVPAAHALAADIAADTAPVSVALARQMMWRMLGAGHPMAAHRAESRAILARGRSADAGEGVTSFLEKRDAVFTDRVSDGLPDVFPEWQEPEFS
ncbi:MAG: putative enoyl-CoA hydratase [Desertimonas sp.]|nr:putative enoyl-CoA hydratase [Desertimonas sp.]